MRKRIGMVFALALLLSVLCGAGMGSAKVHQGTWEKNTKWYYNTKTKTVTIDCKGKMEDNFADHGPSIGWGKWYLKAKKIVFRKGITHIGGGSFDHFREVKEVVLPEGLVSIGALAFWDTYALKTIEFPSTLQNIGKDAFDHSGLQSVSLRNVKKVARGAFSGTHLKSVTIPATCTDVRPYAFSCCSDLKTVTLENGVKRIRNSVFALAGITSVTIPPSVTQIDADAFFAFSPEEGKLKRVTIKSTRIKKWGKGIFGKARKDLVIRVPKKKKKEYTKALREGGLPEYVKIVAG